jgi:Flp pilus assembly protein TadG
MTLRSIAASLRQARDGASAVEFALVAPMFLALVCGIAEYGRLYWTIEALQRTAISGARCMGILQSGCASAGSFSSANTQTYVQGIGAQWGLSIPTAGITLNQTATCGTVAGLSQVSLSYTFTSVVPLIVHLSRSGTTLTATACFPNNTAPS